jgi:hypothetical protein
MRSEKKIATAFLMAATLAFISGCASGPQVVSMIPTLDTSPRTSTKKSVEIVDVTGGEETNSLGLSSIDSKSFKEALMKTLEQSGLFEELVPNQRGDYQLHTQIVSQELLAGFTITTTLLVRYKLIETHSDEVLWKENIFSHYDAEFSEALVGVTRARKANEGAVRDNLSQLVGKLTDVLHAEGVETTTVEN